MKHKKTFLLALAFLVILICSCQDSFYKTPILKVTQVENTFVSQKEGVAGQKENCYEQTVTAVVQNGSHKKETVTFSNDFTQSETLSSEYHKGDKIFVTLTPSEDGTLKITPIYDKRDSSLILIAGIFILLLLYFFQKKGVLTLLSVGINITFFFFCLQFYEQEAFYDWIWMVEVVFFVVVTLLFVSGFHRKTVGAIVSALITVVLVTLLYLVTIYLNTDLSYEMLPDMVPNLPLAKVFLISTILGLLGAVMDIAITINASVSELIAASDGLSLKALIGSIQAIGHDIMGTMVNVLFFSYLSGSFPLIVLKFSNNYAIDTILRNDYVFDLIRFLIGSIGIVLAIPISGAVAVLLFRKGVTSVS